MAIEKQIWIDMILEGGIPDASFLSRSVDMTPLVEYNKINLAEAGVEPEVLFDNNVYPVAVESRTDIPLEIALHTLDTKNTVVRNIEAMELAYDKMASVVRGHKNACTGIVPALRRLTGARRKTRTRRPCWPPADRATMRG